MRKLLMVAVLLLGSLGMTPESRAQFCPGVSPWVFDDVLASDPFCGFITRMAQQNVTLGCIVIDANHRLYCPDDSVTRKQMAAFMARLGDALFPLTCGVGQIMKWNGTAWACAADNTAGGGGTVTSVMAGTGLQGSPNPITGAGSLNVAPSYQLPQACSTNQIPKWNGTAWTCAADAGRRRDGDEHCAGDRHHADAEPAHHHGHHRGRHGVPAAAGEQHVRGGQFDPGDRGRWDGDLPGRQRWSGQCVRAERQCIRCHRGSG